VLQIYRRVAEIAEKAIVHEIQRLKSDQILDMCRGIQSAGAVGRERKRNRPLFFLCSAFSAALLWDPFLKKLEQIYLVKEIDRVR